RQVDRGRGQGRGQGLLQHRRQGQPAGAGVHLTHRGGTEAGRHPEGRGNPRYAVIAPPAERRSVIAHRGRIWRSLRTRSAPGAFGTECAACPSEPEASATVKLNPSLTLPARTDRGRGDGREEDGQE